MISQSEDTVFRRKIVLNIIWDNVSDDSEALCRDIKVSFTVLNCPSPVTSLSSL